MIEKYEKKAKVRFQLYILHTRVPRFAAPIFRQHQLSPLHCVVMSLCVRLSPTQFRCNRLFVDDKCGRWRHCIELQVV